MFFDAATPNTSSYMVAGYVIFFLVTAIYLVSLIVRTRNLGRDLDTLRGLEEQPEQPSAAPLAAVASTRAAAPRAKAPQAKAAGSRTKKPAAAKPARKKTTRRK